MFKVCVQTYIVLLRGKTHTVTLQFFVLHKMQCKILPKYTCKNDWLTKMSAFY